MNYSQRESTSEAFSPVPSTSFNSKSRAKKVIFTPEEEEMIIEHYQQHEFLWNPRHDDYKFGWKSSSVQDLAIAMGNKFTPSEIHTRFSGMRSTYRENAKKVNASTSGSSADDVYVPTWAHYESLKFLDAIQPTRTAQTSYTVQRNDNSMFTDFESLDDIDYPMSPNVTAKGKQTKSKKATEEEVIDECLGVLRAVVNSGDKENVEKVQPKFRCQNFGDYVASSLREMTPWYKSCAMTEISNILFKYDKNNPDDEN